MEATFLLRLPVDLRNKIKREARKHGISMNEYVVTVLGQFVKLQGASNGENTKRDSSQQVDS